MSSYRGTAEGTDQAKAITAVVAVHLALAFVILTGLNVRVVSRRSNGSRPSTCSSLRDPLLHLRRSTVRRRR